MSTTAKAASSAPRAPIGLNLHKGKGKGKDIHDVAGTVARTEMHVASEAQEITDAATAIATAMMNRPRPPDGTIPIRIASLRSLSDTLGRAKTALNSASRMCSAAADSFRDEAQVLSDSKAIIDAHINS